MGRGILDQLESALTNGDQAQSPAQSASAPPMPDVSSLPATSNAPPPSPTQLAIAQMQSGQQPQSQQAQQPPMPTPILAQLIGGLIRPPQSQPDAMGVTRPASRLDVFENFLGNFVTALGQGLQAAHGPGAFGKGFGAAATAPYQQALGQYQLGQQAQVNQADIQEKQAQTAQLQRQTQLAGQSVPVTLPNGQTIFLPVKDASQVLANQYKNAYSADANAKSRMAIAQLNNPSLPLDPMIANAVGHPELANQIVGKATFDEVMKDFNARTKIVGTTRNGTEIREDGNGNLIQIPVTSTTRPNLPNLPMVKGASASTPSAPAAAGTPSGFPRPNSHSGPRIVAQGKSANDVGIAYDPNANEYTQVTRNEASAKGFQQFQKITEPQQEENRQLNNRLADVATKLTRYEGTMQEPLSSHDRYMIASALEDDKFKFGAFGMELPVDWMNQLQKAAYFNKMSAVAQKRIISYFNARESMVGYQRVLSGGSRSNEKAMQLNLDALPNPLTDPQYATESLRQFKENLSIAGQGIPRMPGITSAKDILSKADNSANPQKFPQPANMQEMLNSLGGSQ